MGQLQFCVVCASNFNRSMEGHCVLLQSNLNVKSYGTGTSCKLPGKKQSTPNIYPFQEHTYDDIYNDLVSQDEGFYWNNGLLSMVERNRTIKERPEKFQERSTDVHFDVIICCEERVYDAVIEDLASRTGSPYPVHCINVDIKDNAEQAKIGGIIIKEIAESFETSDAIDEEGLRIMDEMIAKYPDTRFMYSVSFN